MEGPRSQKVGDGRRRGSGSPDGSSRDTEKRVPKRKFKSLFPPHVLTCFSYWISFPKPKLGQVWRQNVRGIGETGSHRRDGVPLLVLPGRSPQHPLVTTVDTFGGRGLVGLDCEPRLSRQGRRRNREGGTKRGERKGERREEKERGR